MDSLRLLQDLVRLPGPPGEERRVREYLADQVAALGFEHRTDAKGNLLVQVGASSQPRVLVTAHMDEIAMLVREVLPDGSLVVGNLGGLYPWKLGEGPVQVLSRSGDLDGVLCFGSIHTDDPASSVQQAKQEGVDWSLARVITGLSADDLQAKGVRPGTRVVVHPCRRDLLSLGELVGGYFLDDRADLVSWLLMLQELRESDVDAIFLASAAEEVGGEGALFAMRDLRPDVCIALELGPNVVDAPVEITDQPTVWVNDGYSAMSTDDLELVAKVGEDLGMDLQFQALSRGGSDASCAASHGLCARPITLGLPMENSHGYEVIHRESMDRLAQLGLAVLRKVA